MDNDLELKKMYANKIFSRWNENESIIVTDGQKRGYFQVLRRPFHFWTFLKMSNFEKTFWNMKKIAIVTDRP